MWLELLVLRAQQCEAAPHTCYLFIGPAAVQCHGTVRVAAGVIYCFRTTVIARAVLYDCRIKANKFFIYRNATRLALCHDTALRWGQIVLVNFFDRTIIFECAALN